jgi:7-carboxy-7-deazaguanine synthase
VEALLSKGIQVSIETNGSLDISTIPDKPEVLISMDIKCLSSGMERRMRMENIPLLREKDQLKFVIADEDDYIFAKKIIGAHRPRCPIVLTPVGGSDLRALAERVIDDRLDARVLPQLHKLIWGERKGV